ncbi:MAG: hypothetical protein PSV36_02500 [Algoriphagus sp.]|nr:hypothetical protein [Algoriphagus sp.]
MKTILKTSASIFIILFLTSLLNPVLAQDTTKITLADTTQLAEADSTAKQEKSDKKKKDSWILYVGGNLNDLDASPNEYSSEGEMGYQLGVNYRRGKFLYWGAGAKFNNAIYGLKALNNTADSSSLSVKSIDIPLTGGLDLLFFTSRVFTIRTFVGVVPSFVMSVTDDTGLDIEKDDLNTFILYGQGGIGIDVLFLDIELGYNMGFSDLLKNDIKSTPGQAFVNLGFRF